LEELDRFAEAMLAIREEIAAVECGEADAHDNVLKMAPHTVEEATATEWNHEYSREKAVYPVRELLGRKFWSSVARVDNAHGDRNLVCSCPPLSDFEEAFT
jgi:glycine dehydrogenase